MKIDLPGKIELKRRGTSVPTEIRAGVTTFLAMAYILFVNPEILAAGGMPREASIAATAVAASCSTLVMGLYSNLPSGRQLHL